MTQAADSWPLDAAKLPLAFSQVREDPRLDLEIAGLIPTGGHVLMIASGGDSAVCLARLHIGRLVLVDVNPAQLALTRCKFYLASAFNTETQMALLGHTAMAPEMRWKKWNEIFNELDLPQDVFAPPGLVAALGPDHCGRYEAAFAELRRLLLPHCEDITLFLQSNDAAEASAMIAANTATGAVLDSSFETVLSLGNLIALFGEGATRNPRRPFHQHFISQLREIITRQAPNDNPWIWQLLSGKYPLATPVDWLRDSSPLHVQPEYFHGPMIDALAQAPEQSMDFVHLSNILDWLSEDEALKTLAAAYRALKPNGYCLIRQLNSSLDIPSLFPALRWHPDIGSRLQLVDRSFFYPQILLASRP